MNPSMMFVKLQIGAATVENSVEVPQITKNRAIIWFRNSNDRFIWKYENINSKGYVHHNDQSSIINSSQNKETTHAQKMNR